MATTVPEPKKRKTYHPPPRRNAPSSTEEKARDANSASHVTAQVGQNEDIKLRILQARNHAVAQARQDGCTANFRIFDSPFGNYLLPVIPTRRDLSG